VTRRRLTGLLALSLPATLTADDRSDALDLISPLASALSAGDAEAFLNRIAEDAPDKARLGSNVRALLAQAEITSSVQLTSLQDGRAEVDWYMEIRSRARSMIMERRKATVIVRIRNAAIVSLEPVDFFKPVEVR
jgi:hypothetical protein